MPHPPRTFEFFGITAFVILGLLREGGQTCEARQSKAAEARACHGQQGPEENILDAKLSQ